MSQKSVLITGCSSGIGYASAVGLRDAGWRVFASCRQEHDCARLRSEGFESPLIDYADTATVTSGLAEVLDATDGTLHAVFNNGAFGTPGAVEDLPTDALRAIFEANFFGWHELTRQVIPVMRAQGHGRIVQCSSVLGFVTMPWRGAYNATKFALEGLTQTLRIEMRDTPIHVILIEPGPIESKFRTNAILQFERWVDWEASPRAEQYRTKLLRKLYKKGGPDPFELPAEAVVKKLRHALESNAPKSAYLVTTPTYLMAAARRILPMRAMDWVLSRG
ncbi:SDR family NAD(P)-dependent oxidoreductase [uncultured Tateyamaria sp.]|uniref:SDR family NAD(P)-dependent oxidoreductase n=1 Tax=uncultured Tateyamaria sp. TaxID=455651 RepID=UPI0026077C7A|nr:SDR family NAD(P)-dependent oxidoreductase [uncultured Tateyamaria sp.]